MHSMYVMVRVNLANDPRVVAIAQQTRKAPLLVVGALHLLWSMDVQYGQTNGDDAVIPRLNAQALDAVTFRGFADAVVAVGWLAFDGDDAVLPRIRDNQTDVRAIRDRWREKKAKQRSRTSGETPPQCPPERPPIVPGDTEGTNGGHAGDFPHRGRGRGRQEEEGKTKDSVAGATLGATSAKTPSRPRRAADPITLDRQASPAEFTGIMPQQRATWQTAFPAVDIDAGLAKAAAWCIAAGPKGHKTAWLRFLTSWLSRAQDDAGRRGVAARMPARPANRPPAEEENPMLAVLAAASAQVAAEEAQGGQGARR